MEMDLTIPTHHKPASQQQLCVKKHGALHLVKVVLYMLKRRRSAKKAQIDVASKGLWKKLVGAMRPLHTQQLPRSKSPSPPPSIELGNGSPNFQDISQDWNNLASPSTSDGSKSRYASALDLQALDKSDDGESIEVVIEEGFFEDGGDEMIDARAEEFIANFYAQMKLQRLESMDRYNQMIRNESAV
ncbi:hypothetical protein AQUCO_00300592v1 [Aquilegia coerulea]|uniref:DUF761 domain-containing protein n=1 Tax=Aquilegia coerulea TaxID=218851 RepID=A0A2G5EZM7_AQUCA|nr:hypothetical protein AQUCO_00300592v1 [Aquilegia coerulea]